MKIALLAQTNVDFLAREIERTSSQLENVEVWTPDYGQIMQSVHDAKSDLYVPAPEAVLLFQDPGDVFGHAIIRPFAAQGAMAQDALGIVRGAVEQIAQRLEAVTVVVNTIPLPVPNGLGALEWNSHHSLRQIAMEYNAGVGHLAREVPGVAVLDYEALVAETGLASWYDRRLWYLARSRLSSQATRILAEAYLWLLTAAHRPRAKCLVLDLDNTCWGGVLGDDGINGIEIGSEGVGLAFSDLQRAVLNLRDQGLLLAVSSKNAIEPVRETFREHRGMVLAESDISAWRVNWNDKATSLREISNELGIGLDSLVFVDDNPAERDLIRTILPEVRVVELPQDPADFAHAIMKEPAFLTLALTDEDMARPVQYQTRAARVNTRTSSADLNDFLRSLQMRAIIGELSDSTATRIAQLTQKTNQFNLRTERYTESELMVMVAKGSHRVFWLRLSDRFGDEGLVVVAIVAVGSPWFLDTFLMSCRVLGRTAEETLLDHISKEAVSAGMKILTAEYIATDRNDLVRDLLPRLEFYQTDDSSQRWTLDVGAPSTNAARFIDVTIDRDLA